ncbi:MAG: hypothetical protein IK077_01440 [Thermoguttaceae bacterium]|nr:hypothetical protein [Thermoguttaceae bacterium]
MNGEYERHKTLWDYVSDCYEGSERVKYGPNALDYLPMSSLERDELYLRGAPFEESRYSFRRRIASYENFFRPVVDDVVGLMQRNPATVRFGVTSDEESAREVRDLRDWGNRFNDGLPGLKARLNFAQILFGRYGMLLDVVANENGLDPKFCIVEYPAQKILDGMVEETPISQFGALRWALLDESTRRFNAASKEWIAVRRLRLLALDARERYYAAVFEGADADARWRAFDIERPSGENVVYPSFKGRTLDFIPFTVCNASDLGIDRWSTPPYLDVARLAVENYVVDSWYKMGLYQHATPTLAVCNAARESNDVRLGGVVWPRGSGSNPVSVSILETNGAGLAELRKAKTELKETLRYTSVRDLIDGAGANSSGDALRVRTTSGTVAVATIDRTGARAIEEQLCFASRWSGASVDETCRRISYRPDVSYVGAEFEMSAVVDLLKTNGETRTLSNRNAYAFLEKAAPGVLPSFEDNEEQKKEDERYGQVEIERE